MRLLAIFTILLALFAEQAQADVTIAVVLPLSGSMASFGEEMRAGSDLAAAEINGKNGVLGEKLVLKYYDDACETSQAVIVANKIIAEKPTAVFGHACSATTLAAAPLYAEVGMPELTISSNPKVTQSGSTNIFRIGGRDDAQAPDLAHYLDKTLAKESKVAVLDDKGSWGIGYADSFTDAYKKAGKTIAWRDNVAQGQKDFSTLISKLKKDGITDVVLGVYLAESALLVRQAHEQGYTGHFYGGDAIQSSDFWKIAGEAGQGVKHTGVYVPSNTPEGKKYAQTLKAENKPIGAYGYYAYAAVQIFAQAIEKAKSKESPVIIAALHNNSFNTLIGNIAYANNGDIKDYHFQLFMWNKGESVPLK